MKYITKKNTYFCKNKIRLKTPAINCFPRKNLGRNFSIYRGKWKYPLYPPGGGV